MKNNLIFRITLLLTVIASLSSCRSENGALDKFIGTWQSVPVPTRKPLLIRREGKAIIVSQGTQSFPATYDPKASMLSFSAPLAGKVDISYLDASDKLLVTSDGEYQRIK